MRRQPRTGARKVPLSTRLVAGLTWLVFPVYAVQGVGVRLRTPRMLPAKGPLTGFIPGEGDEIRLLALGESSAAAVGIARTEDGLAARVAATLARRTGRPVRYRAAGFNGAVAAQLRDQALPHVERAGWTHVLLTIGVNDAKNFNSAATWKSGFGGLLYAVRARFPEARIYWHELLDMRRVPALPAPLSHILELRTRMINALGRRLCEERGGAVIPRMTGAEADAFCATGFCIDGFHPSEAGFASWAGHIVDHMIALDGVDADPAA